MITKVPSTYNYDTDRALSQLRIKINTLFQNLRVNQKGYFLPIDSTDEAAPNSSVYFSTDQNKLVYKDSDGNINNLY